MLNRRRFFATNLAAILARDRRHADGSGHPTLLTRGVVLVPEDLTLADWPERAKAAGLTTIGIHHQNSPQAVIDWTRTEAGRRFLGSCQKLGLEVEYELHAMRELLPRSRFAKNPELFPMDDKGDRNPDANLCVHSHAALDLAAENAVLIAKALRPTTGRYFYWGDDGQPWCRCSQCKGLSDSDQATLLEYHLLRARRRYDPRASLAHLAYLNSLSPPARVRPERGVFLEYAPIRRRYDIPYEKQTGSGQPDALSALDANLKVFPADTAQVLEYWLDVSRFSQWRRPAVRLPWRRDVLEADLATYASRGIRHVTSSAVYVDADYHRRYGEPEFIREYGETLSGLRRR
jgi:Domain of unknown function (DUF4838)